MSEHACRRCGSFLHHADECPDRIPTLLGLQAQITTLRAVVRQTIYLLPASLGGERERLLDALDRIIEVAS